MRMRRHIALSVLVCATLLSSNPALAQFSQQGPKLVGTGAGGNASQGSSVSLSSDGNTAIVGGPNDNGNAGAAWIWTRSGGVWTQQGLKLVGSGAINASQGSSVSLSADGNTAIVGGASDNGNFGAAWVWTRSGGIWTQQGNKLVGAGAILHARQGISVALSGDGNTAIVGGFGDDSNSGAAWVWTRSGGIWTQQGGKLFGSGAAGNAEQGYSVALSADGNTAIVGGYQDNNDAGAVWVWTRSGGAWTQQGPKLVGSDATAFARQGFSVSLSGDGNTAIIGGDNDNGGAGAAWAWTRSGGVWTQQSTKLVGSGAMGTAQQGSFVSLSTDGNTAIVGGGQDNNSAGATWVWTRSGGVWTQQPSKLVGSGAVGSAGQGASVSLSGDGNTAIVGGYFDNSSTGAAWIFAAVQGCAGYSISPQSVSVSGSGASGGVTVAGIPIGCNGKWTSSSNASWISVTSGFSGSGSGPFTLNYSVQPNASSQARSGSIIIAGQTFVVEQGVSVAVRHRAMQPPVSSVQLQVRVFIDVDVPAAGGVAVLVNGNHVGDTSADGTLTVQVPAGANDVRAILPSLALGEASATIAPGASATVDVYLQDAEVTATAQLQSDEIIDNLLPSDFDHLTLRLISDSGSPIAIASLDEVEIGPGTVDFEDSSIADTSDFTVSPSNDILVTSLTELKSLANSTHGPVKISATIIGQDFNTYAADVTFNVGWFRLSGHLEPPKSKPTLSVAGRAILLEVLNTNIEESVVTAADGHFESKLLPPGTVAISTQVLDSGTYYSTNALVVLDADRSVDVDLLSVDDIVNGASTGAMQGGPPIVAPRGAQVQHRAPSSSSVPCAVTVSGGAEGVEMKQTLHMVVPLGTTMVWLRYTVSTEEYPVYVSPTNQFDDVWEIRVLGPNGQPLLSPPIHWQVNSQLSDGPVWQADGSTGDQLVAVDVEALTRTSSALLSVIVSSTNIGDGLYPTTVCASLTADAPVTIVSALQDQAAHPVSGGCDRPGNTQPPEAGSAFYSVPEQGSANVFPRYLVVTVEPDDTTVTAIQVDLYDHDGGDILLSKVIEEPIGGLSKKVDSKRILVPVTFSPNGSLSNVAASPPPTGHIFYRVTLTTSGPVQPKPKDSPVFRPLWRWPGDRLGIPRYSCRELGGDDWCSKGAYAWIEANVTLLSATSVNDISGEHGRNIGHREHKEGTDLDVYHFTRLTKPGASAAANYGLLASEALKALSGGSKDTLVVFFTTLREKLAQLASDPKVNHVFSGRGAKSGALPDGWMEQLTRCGQVRDTLQLNERALHQDCKQGNVLIDLALGSWDLPPDPAGQPKVTFNHTHDNHIHIKLDHQKIGD